MRAGVVFLVIAMLLGCANQTNELQSQFDEIKWKMYLLYCDYNPKGETKDSLLPMPLGTYALKFDSLFFANKDGITFYFNFILKDSSPIICVSFPDLKDDLMAGMVHFKGMDTMVVTEYRCLGNYIVYYSKNSGGIPDTTSRLINDIKPDVIKFIQESKKRLDPWFYKEAVKRGILKE